MKNNFFKINNYPVLGPQCRMKCKKKKYIGRENLQYRFQWRQLVE
jgi:hypothetical protein